MEALRRLNEVVASGGQCVLVTIVSARGSTPRRPGARLLLEADGRRTGTVGGGEAEERALQAAREMLAGGHEATRSLEVAAQCGGVTGLLIERFGTPARVVVLGAGHVGRAVASLAARVGFAVTLLDREGGPEVAGELPVARGELTALLEAVERPQEAQVIVATGSHEADRELAVAALRLDCAGVGVLGSRTKAAAVRSAVESAGLADRLPRLRCPIGLDLGGETPEEIAVAVLAELVLLRRRGEVPESWRKPSVV